MAGILLEPSGLRADLATLRAELATLRAELATLRAELAALRPIRPTVRLRSGGRWLGEPARVVAGVTNGRAGSALLAVTTAGCLETTAGGTRLTGRAVSTATGTRGEVELTWLPDAAVDLNAGQQAALGARLVRLDEASSPAEAAQVLSALAGDYLREPARAFREAVDGLARGRRDGAIPAVDDPLRTWPLLDAVVTVHALATPPSDLGTAVIIGSATVLLRTRDWVPAFAEALRRQVAETAALASQLRTESGRAADAATLGAALQARIGSWVANRPGRLGQEVAVEVAEDATREQLAATTQRPLADRRALVPLLSSSARAVGQVPPTVLGAIEAAGSVVRLDVVDRFTKMPVLDPGVLDAFDQRLDRLAGQITRHVTVDQLNDALANKLDRSEGLKIQGLINRVERLEQRFPRPP